VSALLLPRGRDLHTSIEQDLPALESAGVTHLRVQASMFAASLDEIPGFIEDLLRRLEPYR
jgi:hypothetical protein